MQGLYSPAVSTYGLSFLLLLSACAKPAEVQVRPNFDVQGHRGARGLYPENSLAGFAEALRLGVTTLELDVVVSADSQVVVSHEPYFRERTCALAGTGYTGETSLFELPYAAIQQVPCGADGDIEFPYQRQLAAPKPRLREVLRTMDRLADSLGRDRPAYNIELKAKRGGEPRYTPDTEVYVYLVLQTVREEINPARVLFQAYEDDILKALHRADPTLRIGMIADRAYAWHSRVDALGFTPEACIAYHLLLTPGTVRDLQTYGLRVLPWTVNDPGRMRELISWGVDGIITDYPDRLVSVLSSYPF